MLISLVHIHHLASGILCRVLLWSAAGVEADSRDIPCVLVGTFWMLSILLFDRSDVSRMDVSSITGVMVRVALDLRLLNGMDVIAGGGVQVSFLILSL